MDQDRPEARLFLASANRPPGDYTSRGIPRRTGSAVPLEGVRIIVAASDEAHPSCRPTYRHRAAGWGRGGRQAHTCLSRPHLFEPPRQERHGAVPLS
jgi:hypothetical protein